MTETPERAPPALTPRQLDVAKLVGEGYTTKQIQARLGLSERSVQCYVVAIAHLVSPGDHSKDDRIVVARWWWEQQNAA